MSLLAEMLKKCIDNYVSASRRIFVVGRIACRLHGDAQINQTIEKVAPASQN